MMAASRPDPKSDSIDPIPENLFRSPVDYLAADHYRQHLVCQFLDEIVLAAGAANVARLAGLALGYLEHDMPRHIADEEEDLFPLLRQRAKPEHRIDSVIARLTAEHAHDEGLSAEVCAGLRRLAKGEAVPAPAEFSRVVASYAESHRRHLGWEEDVVMPLARRLLSGQDMAAMGRRMAERHGAGYPE